MRARSRGSIVLALAVVLASAVGCASPVAHNARGASTSTPSPSPSRAAVHFRVRVAAGPPAIPAPLVRQIGYSFAAPTAQDVRSARSVDAVLDTYWTSVTATGGSAPEATVAYLERVSNGATGRHGVRLEWIVLDTPTGRSVVLGRPHPRPSSTPAVTIEFDEFDAISGAWIKTTEK